MKLRLSLKNINSRFCYKKLSATHHWSLHSSKSSVEKKETLKMLSFEHNRLLLTYMETSDVGRSKAEPNITWPGKTNLMLDAVEFNNCFIIPKHTSSSNQLQIQQRAVSLFASACLILQIHEINHKTILDLPFKQLVASLGYLWPCKIRLKLNLNFK